MKQIFEYIKADKFFPSYAQTVKNYKHKCRGKNGRGNPIEFSEQDKKEILRGLKNLFADLKKPK